MMMGADWCGVCKAVLPEFEKASKAFGDKVTFVYLDSDKVGIENIKFDFIPAYVAGKDFKDVKTGRSLNKQKSRFAEDLIKYTTEYTGVKPLVETKNGQGK